MEIVIQAPQNENLFPHLQYGMGRHENCLRNVSKEFIDQCQVLEGNLVGHQQIQGRNKTKKIKMGTFCCVNWSGLQDYG